MLYARSSRSFSTGPDAVRRSVSIRRLEGQQLSEARFKLRLEEARVEQFVRRRELAVAASRQLAHVSAGLRQAVR